MLICYQPNVSLKFFLDKNALQFSKHFPQHKDAHAIFLSSVEIDESR